MQRFSTKAAILTFRFPLKAPELFAYQATIIRAARNYASTRWVAYARQFRHEALSQRPQLVHTEHTASLLPRRRPQVGTLPQRTQATPCGASCMARDYLIEGNSTTMGHSPATHRQGEICTTGKSQMFVHARLPKQPPMHG